MCGRFVSHTSTTVLARHLQAEICEPLPPRYNIAPTQAVLALRLNDHGQRFLSTLRWGLVPAWAKDLSISARMINARVETVHEKPAFRSAFRQRRCLIPANGFYEWHRTPAGKQPYYCRIADAAPFCFAGLWEYWQDSQGEGVESCTILTAEANESMQAIHHRMPVILPSNCYDWWLAPTSPSLAELRHCLQTAEGLEIQAVSSYVNNARHEGPQCIQALL